MSPSRQPLLPASKPPPTMSGINAVSKDWSRTDNRRIIVFVVAVSVGLASGSNYVYSAYAPQLATQLHISSTQSNLVGLAGNLGVYTSGPLWGKLVDARGQQISLLLGSIIIFIGYYTVHSFYNLSIPIRAGPSDPPSHLGIFFLCLAMFLSGLGGCAGLTSAINAVAKSFPDKTRASATGTVLAGFGLSAFAFSTAGHLIYGGDAGGLLLLLAFGTGVPMLIGSFIIKPIPPRHADGYQPIRGEAADIIIDEDEVGPNGRHSSTTSLELSRSRSPTSRRYNSDDEESTSPTKIPLRPNPLNPAYRPLELIVTTDFWILFIILSLLCGTGLMYINNAGTVALALARGGQVEYDRKAVSAWQAQQVATVSVWNCIGRIAGGVVSDFCKTRFGVQRIWFLPIVAIMFIASQVAALDTTTVGHLWIVSTMLGTAYGSLFNVLPMLVLEWFGMSHFSQNYGWIAVAPVIGGNTFNLIFGRVYDSNTIGHTVPHVLSAGIDAVRSLLKRADGAIPDDPGHDCIIGTRCYASAFKIATMGCLIALGLSILAGIRRERLRLFHPQLERH